MAVINANPIEVILKNTTSRVNIEVVNAAGTPVDATALVLKVLEDSEAELLVDNYFAAGTRIAKISGTAGKYYFPFGAGANETTSVDSFLFHWQVETASGQEQANVVQYVRVVSPRSLALLPYFRLMIDKSVKEVDESIGVQVGYSDSQLLQFLESGVQVLNVYGQGLYAYTLENFPVKTHRILLLLTALHVGLMSQSVFAIDTDSDFSDSGLTFNNQHFQKLQTMLAAMGAQIKEMAQPFKWEHVKTGSVRTEMGAHYRLNQLLLSGPAGATFRALFTVGQK